MRLEGSIGKANRQVDSADHERSSLMYSPHISHLLFPSDFQAKEKGVITKRCHDSLLLFS